MRIRRLRTISLGMAAGVSLVVLGLLLFFPEAEPGPLAGPNPAPAPTSTVPPLSWSPDHITITLTPGEDKVAHATATLMTAIGATTADVVPALAPYIRVTPASLPGMAVGSTQVFELTFQAPAGTEFQTIEGTLHLRAGDSTVARPLPITLNIWRSFQLASDSSTVTFVYPPDWELSVSGPTAFLDDPALSAPAVPGCELQDPPCNAEDAPELTLNIKDDAASMPLTQFVNTFQEGWFLLYRELNATTINAAEAIVASDLGSDTPQTPVLAAFIKGPGGVVLLTAHSPLSQEEFFLVMVSLQVR